MKTLDIQYNVELWRFPDRTTQIGQMINAYLKGDTETDDAAMHLLFSANRWEKRCASAGSILWWDDDQVSDL